MAESVFFELNVFPETDCKISVSSEDIFNEYDGEAEYSVSEDTLQSSPTLRHLVLKSPPKSMLLRDCDCDDIRQLSTTGTAERVNSIFPCNLPLMKQLSEFFWYSRVAQGLCILVLGEVICDIVIPPPSS